jgi:hypothetical protein
LVASKYKKPRIPAPIIAKPKKTDRSISILFDFFVDVRDDSGGEDGGVAGGGKLGSYTGCLAIVGGLS